MTPSRTRAPRLWTALIAALIGMLALVGCTNGTNAAPAGGGTTTAPSSAAPTFPRDVTVGNATVHLEHKPTAIVVLSPSLTETVYGVGAGPQVKAVDKLSNFPADVAKSDLDAFAPNVEAILAMKPDLVLLSNDQDSIVAKLTALKITVAVLPAPNTLAEVWTQFEQVGQLTGNEAAATELVTKTKAQVAAAVAKAQGSSAKTYYWELDPTYYSVTSTTFIGSVLKEFGLTSIADKAPGADSSGGYPQLSAEYIIDADPDLIIAPGGDAAAIRKRAGWDVTRAVKDTDGILVVDNDVASRWGPRVGDLADQIAASLEKLK